MGEAVGNFDVRTAALRGRGFNVEAPTGDLASEQMLRLEKDADQAADVRARVLTLPDPHRDRRDALLTRLADPAEAEAVEIELNSLLRRHRPWVIVADRARVRWSDEGRSVELSRLLERLDQLDDSLVLAAPRITSLIEAGAPWRDILPVLEELEARNSRRIGALDGMMAMLSTRGWDVTTLESGGLHERFAVAEKLHGMDARLARCQRHIEADIRPFGDDLAERLWAATVVAQRESSAAGVQAVEDEIEDMSQDLSRRLARVEERIARWQHEGFEVLATLPLLAGEMILWEQRMPEIAGQVEATHGLWAQIEPHLAQWPEYRRLAERTRGHLGAIDALEVLLHGLSAKTDGARAACRARIELWGGAGIDTTVWAPLIDGEPRAVLEELDGHQQLINLILPTISTLEAIDVSIRGADEVAVHLSRLRRKGAVVQDVEEAHAWLDLASRRNERHRNHLDRARKDLATLWPAKLDPGTLDIAAYESAISGLESGVGLPSFKRVEARDVGRMDRVSAGLEREFQDWSALGWMVEGLRELLDQDPVRLGLDLPSIREAVDGHEARLARLEPLPWGLDVNLAERVLSDLSRPERLPGLDAEIPDLLRTLSSGKGRADPDFNFEAFRPHAARAHIEAQRPLLVPEEVEELHEEIEAETVSKPVPEPSTDPLPEPEPVPEPGTEIEESVEDIMEPAETISWLEEVEVERTPQTSGPPQKVEVDWLAAKDPQEDFFDSMIRQASTPETRDKTIPKKVEKVPEVEPEEKITADPGRVRELLGLDDDSKSIENLLSNPMDVRVQRLARLAEIIDAHGHDDLFSRLLPLAKKLDDWTRERVTRRHGSSGLGLIQDAVELGNRLIDIPGPGAPMSLDRDQHPLPAGDDLAALQTAVSRLEQAVRLPSARIQTVQAEA